jgi:hypothetical protein
MTLLQHNEDFPSTDDKSNSTIDNETKSLFDDSNNNTSNTNDIEILSNKINSNIDNKVYLSDDKGLQPSEYYLAKVVSLNVKRL